jgi:hypothetical protein
MISSVRAPEGEHLIIPPGALVYYVDDCGDEKFGNREHPFLAFGGVACTSEFHIPLANYWKDMKAANFRQLRGPLHPHIRRSPIAQDARDQALINWSSLVPSRPLPLASSPFWHPDLSEIV